MRVAVRALCRRRNEVESDSLVESEPSGAPRWLSQSPGPTALLVPAPVAIRISLLTWHGQEWSTTHAGGFG